MNKDEKLFAIVQAVSTGGLGLYEAVSAINEINAAKEYHQAKSKEEAKGRIEYLLNSVTKAQDHNFTGELDAYYKGCKDGIIAAFGKEGEE